MVAVLFLLHRRRHDAEHVPHALRPVQYDADGGAQLAQLHLRGLRAFAPRFVSLLLCLLSSEEQAGQNRQKKFFFCWGGGGGRS
eukprot:COSAG06_NODE_7845_length_2354_cov_124.351220_4_plen_84_part_00